MIILASGTSTAATEESPGPATTDWTIPSNAQIRALLAERMRQNGVTFTTDSNGKVTGLLWYPKGRDAGAPQEFARVGAQ
ncbi:MAG TPA: hypothetical protein VF193_15005 [Steroidobacter sp.]